MKYFKSFLFLILIIIFSPKSFAHSPNPGVIEIEHPGIYKSVVAISDVHGMYDATIHLLTNGKIIDQQHHWIAGNTLLIIVGDSIDKGPKSIDLLDLWIQLQSEALTKRGRVIHLLGNHEAEFLSNPMANRKIYTLKKEIEERGLKLEEFTNPNFPRGEFLLSMPLAAKIGSWLICHSGQLPDLSWNNFVEKASSILQKRLFDDPFLLGPESILESKSWWKKEEGRVALEALLSKNSLFGVVFGHQPKGLKVEGKSAITADGRIIKIDNGMADDAGSHEGSLLVFKKPNQMKKFKKPDLFVINASGVEEVLVTAP